MYCGIEFEKGKSNIVRNNENEESEKLCIYDDGNFSILSDFIV